MERDLPDIRMDPARLYREELFTDRRVGTVRRLVPIRPDGTDDPGRTVIFEGQTTLLTPAGSLPVAFGIEARTLAEAVEKFAGGAQNALEQTLKDLEELRRAAASPLIVPDVGAAGLGGPGGPRGGGRIRMP
jgi:hypothetical protein